MTTIKVKFINNFLNCERVLRRFTADTGERIYTYKDNIEFQSNE
jgi:hypothetical protein